MRIEIVALGKIKDRNYQALVQDYVTRVGRYTSMTHTELREIRVKESVPVVLRKEAERLEDRCEAGTYRVALDERGELWSSVQFAQEIEQWRDMGIRHVAFFLGSAYGLDPDFREGCDKRLALSPMTMPHDMARLVLAEQLYRAMTILRGEPYHK